MHRSLVSMQDLPVISAQGVRLGTIQDACFEPSEQRIVAFAVDWENDMIRGPEDMLPIMQISELTADVVTVPDELGVAAGLEFDYEVDTDALMPALVSLIGKGVGFENGELLGELVDIHVDPADGSVAFYEIAPPPEAQGDGPNYMLAPEPSLNFQGDRLVISNDARHRLTRSDHLQPDESQEEEMSPRTQLNISFLEEDEDRVGEDDVELTRSQTQQPY